MLANLINENAYIEIDKLCSATIKLKVEGLNPAGSIKLKTAISIIADLEFKGLIKDETKLIESSSGNLGVALAMICAEKGYEFTCVIDPNTSIVNKEIIETLGAKVITVVQKDENGGYLNSRINLIKDIVSRNENYIWINQYQNLANPLAHYLTTAKHIAKKFNKIDYLFIGVGTAGTLMGCRDYFSKYFPKTKIIAVDSVGSITFGGVGSPRYIPGLGTSRKPEIFNPTGISDFILIPEEQAIKICRWFSRKYGFLIGGSTGTVLAGIKQWGDVIKHDDTVVAISPDLGDRYLKTIYSDEWVLAHFNASALQPILLD